MADEDVTKKSGIYYYVFDGKEKHLSIRSFLDRDKRTVYEQQGGISQFVKIILNFQKWLETTLCLGVRAENLF